MRALGMMERGAYHKILKRNGILTVPEWYNFVDEK
jgi:hypothetical protein